MVGTWHSHCQIPGFDSCQGTKIPQAAQWGQKIIMKSNLKKKEKEIPYFHYLTIYISDFVLFCFVCVCLLQCSVTCRILNPGLNPGHHHESTESWPLACQGNPTLAHFRCSVDGYMWLVADCIGQHRERIFPSCQGSAGQHCSETQMRVLKGVI